jgi:hypothetical protein
MVSVSINESQQLWLGMRFFLVRVDWFLKNRVVLVSGCGMCLCLVGCVYVGIEVERLADNC